MFMGSWIIHEKYQRLRWQRITRSRICHLWIVRIKRLMRSPIRSGVQDLYECCFRIGWPFFGNFFWPPKKSYKREKCIKGKFRSAEWQPHSPHQLIRAPWQRAGFVNKNFNLNNKARRSFSFSGLCICIFSHSHIFKFAYLHIISQACWYSRCHGIFSIRR